MKNKSIKSLVIVIAILALAITIAGCSSSKNIAAGSTWEVAKTTDLSELTIADGAAIKAPEGYSVTMTVNSIGTAINPGTYKGKIVLTVTEEIKIGGMPGGGMPAGGSPDAGGGMPGGGAPVAGAPGGAGGAPGGEVGGMPGAAPVGGAPGGAPGREGGPVARLVACQADRPVAHQPLSGRLFT
jgi:hypothetical protein